MLPQIEMTLNMWRTSRRDPSISADEALEGAFDYNRTPIAPIGTPAVLYDKERGTFAPHGTNAFAPPGRTGWWCASLFDTVDLRSKLEVIAMIP